MSKGVILFKTLKKSVKKKWKKKFKGTETNRLKKNDGEYERTDIYTDASKGEVWEPKEDIKWVNERDEKNERWRDCRYMVLTFQN